MDQADNTLPGTEAAPITPWQRLMTGHGFLPELHRLYDARFMLELEMLVGPKADAGNLRAGVEAAARAYIRERRRMRKRKPGAMEYRRLSALSDKLEAVSVELARVQDSPNCSGKLADALETQARSSNPSAAGIANLIEGAFGPGDPVGHIAAFVELLHKATAETVALGEHDTPSSYYEADLDRWSRRPKKTESQPIAALTRAFRPYWERNAMRPFNAGRYDPATKQNKATAVDAIHLIGQKLDPDLTRARVVTVMRVI
ncbi:hypothetical protein [Ruegeria sp. HKCCD7559]|uniref:hypothetical protein n=1 Tax=Ruegeria sp. HKCCD7559 TaxID=2683005 RepID=UPI00149233DB|nr:hypothetical protein [Ruegeria sp. HKCCD7559]NOC47041.1 hypothetical protein [Ruegeria sp. HKCCD7559]